MVEAEFTVSELKNKRCRLCKRQGGRENYHNNKEKIKIAKREYRENNKEKVKEASRKSIHKRQSINLIDGKCWCILCERNLDAEYFGKCGIAAKRCKSCRSKEESRRYHLLKNDDDFKKKRTDWFINNKDDINKKRKEYRRENIEEVRLKDRQRYARDRERIIKRGSKYTKNRVKTDPSFKLHRNFSRQMHSWLNENGLNKNNQSVFKILGYTLQDLQNHLRSTYEYWMNDNNQGIYSALIWDDNDPSTWVWNIDHIRPASSFNMKERGDEEMKKCWALSNLRAYSAKQNVIDGARGYRKVNK